MKGFITGESSQYQRPDRRPSITRTISSNETASSFSSIMHIITT